MKANEESVSSVAPSEKAIQLKNSNGGEMQICVDKENRSRVFNFHMSSL